MDTANILVALGGDLGNTVPKYEVTAAEIAVLQAIHGNDAVFDIEPTGSKKISNREELERIRSIYGGAKDRENNSIVGLLFPGAAARVFDSLSELNLVDSQFKVPPAAVEQDDIADVEPKKKVKAVKGKKAKEEVIEDEIEELEADDVMA